jgi:hypothetical protein
MVKILNAPMSRDGNDECPREREGAITYAMVMAPIASAGSASDQ